MSNTSGLLWWVSPLQGSDWMALRKFILEERSYSYVWATVAITRWDPSVGQSIILAMTLAINNFPLKLLKLNQNNELNFS